MPFVSGLAAAEQLRLGGSRLPVILMSAYSDEELSARVRLLGNALLLRKPFEPSALDRALIQLVDRDH
jgi:FixJ family two-component response regulator